MQASSNDPKTGLRRVLLADDDELSREFLHEALASSGYDVVAASDGEEAVALLEGRARAGDRFDLVVTDLKMPGRDGLEVAQAAKACFPGLPVMLVTAYGTMSTAVEALRGGVEDVLEKPVRPEDLEIALQRVHARSQLARENRYLQDLAGRDNMLVAGPKTQELVDLVGKVAVSDETVLITGESGTGKEQIARLVHRASPRRNGPFVSINCGAIPESLIESELFGHEAGAFTGATSRREGRFELADGGTLFLDEIGEMPVAMQVKLLRVMQEGEISRVGQSTSQKVDVRIVAATHRDLRADVENGRFRADLWYRLMVLPVGVPPLRERTEEILPLARHFVAEGCAITAAAAQLLEAHAWPGNVRELQNVIRRACVLSDGPLIGAELIRPWLDGVDGAVALRAESQRADETTVVVHPPSPSVVAGLVGRTLRSVEAELVAETLKVCRGNRGRAAKMLGIGVRTLYDKVKRAEREPATRT